MSARKRRGMEAVDMIVKVTALCVAVAMICSALRLQRPELATAVSLAAGLAVLIALASEAGEAVKWLNELKALMSPGDDIASAVLKGAGIAIVSELGAQLCADAGESALAGRIVLAARLATLGLCAPMLAELTHLVGGLLG